MIRYDLRCRDGHSFDCWFRDSGAFDTLLSAGQVTCAICGSTDVEKAIMAPSVKPGPGETPLTAPRGKAEQALTALRQHLETNADYVGRDFAAEARRIHDGETDARAIWGEARIEDARALHEDGVPVAPLPLIPRRDD